MEQPAPLKIVSCEITLPKARMLAEALRQHQLERAPPVCRARYRWTPELAEYDVGSDMLVGNDWFKVVGFQETSTPQTGPTITFDLVPLSYYEKFQYEEWNEPTENVNRPIE